MREREKEMEKDKEKTRWGTFVGDKDGEMAACSRQRQTDERKMEGGEIFFIIQIRAQWQGKVKYNDKYIMMLNDDMMNVGGTGSRDVTMSGQKHFHKGAADASISPASQPRISHRRPTVRAFVLISWVKFKEKVRNVSAERVIYGSITARPQKKICLTAFKDFFFSNSS